MPGLIDITPAVEMVDVRGHSVEVNGLGVEAIGSLFLRFPKFRQMVETNKWDVPSLLKMSDDAIHAIIASSCNGAFTEQTAGYLGLGEKAELLAVIFRITMPKGPGPFVDLMRTFGLIGADAASSMGSGTTSPSQLNSSNGTATRKPKSTPQESLLAG
jgi:hypothetical protein